jgi:hypothetical protein
MDTRDDRSAGLLAWQFSLYPEGHQDRRNLLIHAFTTPLFLAGSMGLVTAFAARAVWPGLVGLALMALTLALQGRGHAQEAARPVPFRGPLDAAARLFVEQWITFPRFVLSGGFAHAWRAAAPKR